MIFYALFAFCWIAGVDKFYDWWKFSGEDRYLVLREKIAKDPVSYKLFFADGTWIQFTGHSNPFGLADYDYETVQTMDGNWYDLTGRFIQYARGILNTRYGREFVEKGCLDKKIYFKEFEKLVKEFHVIIKMKERHDEKLASPPIWKGELPDEWKLIVQQE